MHHIHSPPPEESHPPLGLPNANCEMHKQHGIIQE